MTNGNDIMLIDDIYSLPVIEDEVIESVEPAQLEEVARTLAARATIVQLDMDGNILLTDSNASFATSKEQAKEILGSVEKINNELMIADAVNKRSIIVDVSSTQIIWQYDSDRYICDFHIVPQEMVEISILNDSINGSTVFIKHGSTIIWKNNSASPISIYSGTTTYDDFQLDPDLNLYGDVFKSGVLHPGETYSFKFVNVGEFDWFVYPDILTGTINVTRHRISSRDQYIITESDGLDSPFSSRIIKVDSWGNVLWSFGEGFVVKPRDARPLSDGKVIIST